MDLRAKRVLVTRAAHQGSRLAACLRELGAEPILIPAIEIVGPSTFAGLDEAVGKVRDFDWLLFTSVNAVEVVQRRFGAEKLRGVKIGAIGRGTAAAVEAVGLGVDLVPERAVAEDFAAALLPYARRADGAATRFLLVRAEEAREYLPETLRGAGGDVTIATAYRTVIPGASVEAVRELFAGAEGFPDAVTFTSSSTVRNLFALLGAAGVGLPMGVVRASIGPVTSQTLRELGYAPDVEAREASPAALAEAILDWFRGERGLSRDEV